MESYFLKFLPYLLAIVLLVRGIFFVVKQQTAAIMERFGKFTAVRQSGLQMKVPFIDKVAGRLSLKIHQIDVFV